MSDSLEPYESFPKLPSKPLPIPNPEKSDDLKPAVTIPTTLLIKILLRDSTNFLPEVSGDYVSRDHILVGKELADLLAGLDPKEQLIHIEPPNSVVNQSRHWQVWNKKAWHISYQLFCRQRELADLRRQAIELRNIKIAELQAAIMEELDMPDEARYRKIAMYQAVALVQNKNVTICQSIYHVDISMLSSEVTEETTIVGDPADHFEKLWKDEQ